MSTVGVQECSHAASCGSAEFAQSPRLPLRVSHVITEGHMLGGAQYNTLYSLRYQAKSGHAVELVVGNEGPLRQACHAEGIDAILVPLTNRLVDPVRDLSFLIRLTRHYRLTKPDVVHTHTSKAGMLGRVAARLAGVAVVVHTVHGHPFHDRQPWIVRSAIRGMERRCARITDKIITTADSVAHEFIDNRVCGPETLTTIVSGIDFRRWAPPAGPDRGQIRSDLGADPAETLIVSVAHLWKDKGYDVLLEAMEAVKERVPRVRLAIVGTGYLEEDVRTEIVRRGLENDVVICGHRDDVPQILTATDVFVQASRREALSRSLVEAMYTGIGVVASDVGGTREVMTDGVTGYVVPSGDSRALTSAIVRLIEYPAESKRMGENAHEVVAGTRSVESMGTALDTLYHQLLTAKAKNSGEETVSGRGIAFGG